MSPPISRETAQTLADTIKMVKLVETQDAKIQPQYKKMSEGLKAGIDNASEEEISLYRPQLEKVGKQIDTCLSTIQGAIGLLSQLRKDEALMEAKFDQIEKLVKSVAAKRKKLSEQSAEARKLDADADKALVAAQKGAQSAEAELSALQAQVASFMETIKYIDTEMPKLEAAAEDGLRQEGPEEADRVAHQADRLPQVQDRPGGDAGADREVQEGLSRHHARAAQRGAVHARRPVPRRRHDGRGRQEGLRA